MAAVLPLLLLVLLACQADFGGSNAGWSPVAAGQVVAEDGTTRTMVFVGTLQGEVLALDAAALKQAVIGAGQFTRQQIGAGGLLWRFTPQSDPKPGGAFSPAAVGDEMLYIGINDDSGDAAVLYALRKDRPNGAALAVVPGEWSQRIEGKLVGGPALTQAQDMVLVGSDEGILYAFDATTGDDKWRYPSVGTIGQIWSTPAVDDQRVYFGSMDHKVYALSLQDGTLALGWPFETGGAIVAQPLLLERMVIVGSFDRKLYGIDAQTGTGRSLVSADGWFWAGAVTDGSSIFAPSMDGKVYILDRVGIPLSTVEIDGPIVSTPLTLEANGESFVVVVSEPGNIYLLRGGGAATQSLLVPGTQLRADLVLGSRVKAPLSGVDDTIFVATTEGTVLGIALENQRLNELWRVDTKER